MSDELVFDPSGFTVERSFRVWHYTVSHMTLMLRSAAWQEGEETIDVWFDGVAAMSLHQRFEPLTVRAADPDERERLLAHAARNIYDPVRRPPLFLVLASADQPDGFVVCAHASVRATTRGPGILGAPPVELFGGRLLWSAGPTGLPEPRHRFTLHEEGEAHLRAQAASRGPRRAD